MGKKLVLFDLDGVLLNSKINMKLSWDLTCKKHNLGIGFEDYFSKIGRPFKDILNILNIKENQDNIEQTYNDTSIQLISKISFYDGVETVLDQLFNNNIKTGIITSKPAIKTQKFLDLLDFQFDIVQTPNNDLQGKPSPDHILYAISKLNVNASNVIYIGDMGVDYEAAKRAKVDYAHALWGYGSCDDENTIKLKKITQLMDIVKK